MAALGFRAHTGWAAAVAVTPDWHVIERRRLSYEPEVTRFIFHHAAEVPAASAGALIEMARAQAFEKARDEIETLIAVVQSKGKTVVAAGVPGGNNRLPDVLSEILAVHSRIHAAEGAFYRDVLADACAHMDVRVKRMPERELWIPASKRPGSTENPMRIRIAALGKQLGPPWGEDQKLATLAAFAAFNI